MDSRMRLVPSRLRMGLLTIAMRFTACLAREMFMAIVVIVVITALVAMMVMMVNWVALTMVMSNLVIVSFIRHNVGMSLQSLTAVVLLPLIGKSADS